MDDDDDDEQDDGWKILRPGVVLFETTIGLVHRVAVIAGLSAVCR